VSVIIVLAFRWTTGATSLFVNASPTEKISTEFFLVENGRPEAISKTLQLVAERTGQEYNQRKGRKGAFWEDRYHATAIQYGDHLICYLVYIDLK
jgi:hypothetical protein